MTQALAAQLHEALVAEGAVVAQEAAAQEAAEVAVAGKDLAGEDCSPAAAEVASLRRQVEQKEEEVRGLLRLAAAEEAAGRKEEVAGELVVGVRGAVSGGKATRPRSAPLVASSSLGNLLHAGFSVECEEETGGERNEARAEPTDLSASQRNVLSPTLAGRRGSEGDASAAIAGAPPGGLLRALSNGGLFDMRGEEEEAKEGAEEEEAEEAEEEAAEAAGEKVEVEVPSVEHEADAHSHGSAQGEASHPPPRPSVQVPLSSSSSSERDVDEDASIDTADAEAVAALGVMAAGGEPPPQTALVTPTVRSTLGGRSSVPPCGKAGMSRAREQALWRTLEACGLLPHDYEMTLGEEEEEHDEEDEDAEWMYES